MDLILSAVLCLCTAVYTWINWLMYKENIASRLQKSEPVVIPYLKSTDDSSSVFLHVKNVGEGTAVNVHVKLLEDFCIGNDKNKTLNIFPLFSDSVRCFPPGFELSFFLGFWQKIVESKEKQIVKLVVEYQGLDGSCYESDKFCFDIDEVKGMKLNPPGNSSLQIPYYLKKISETLDKKK